MGFLITDKKESKNGVSNSRYDFSVLVFFVHGPSRTRKRQWLDVNNEPKEKSGTKQLNLQWRKHVSESAKEYGKEARVESLKQSLMLQKLLFGDGCGLPLPPRWATCLAFS